MDEWLAEYRPRIDNLRAALDWTFSPSGDASIIALTVASVPLWVDVSMMAECRRHIERALVRLTSLQTWIVGRKCICKRHWVCR